VRWRLKLSCGARLSLVDSLVSVRMATEDWDEAMDEEEEEAEQRVKFEQGKNGKGKGKDKSKGKGKWGKNEDLSDEEKINRRIAWLNSNLSFAIAIEESEVAPALDCIGLRHAMSILRRLETTSDVSNPNDFITDAVARSGWIWSRPDFIDDDEKVAKRVMWLNQFGGLNLPIDYAEVADMLDGLKVPHAMVLLRELEIQGTSIADPTSYIKEQIAVCGTDDVQLPEVDAAREHSAIGRAIAALNDSGVLAAPIEFGEVMAGLMKIGDAQAMSLLKEVEAKGPSAKDPTGFLKFKLKAKLASMGFSLESLKEAARDPETEILKRIEWLNDYGGISQDIDYNAVAKSLESLGIEHAMTILKELEDKRTTVRDPTAFIRQAASHSAKRSPPAAPPQPRSAQAPRASKPAAPAAAGTDFQTLSGFVGILNKRSKKQIKFSDIAGALDTLGPRASVVLREMQEKGLGLEDPINYINAAAFRYSKDKAKMKRGGEEDDVQKLTRKMTWLNQFGNLSETIQIEDVVGALYCLGVPQSMAILKGLQERGSKVRDPTRYIKTAVQRANGLIAAKVEEKEEEEAEAEEENDESAEAAFYAATEDDGLEFEDPGEEQAEEQMDDQEAGDAAELAAALEGVEEEDSMPVQKTKPKAVQSMISKRNQATSYFPYTEAKQAEVKTGTKRVIGAVTGYHKQVPKTAKKLAHTAPRTLLEMKQEDGEDDSGPVAPSAPPPSSTSTPLPLSPQEKVVQVRNLALKVGLHLDDTALKSLARLPFYKARDLIDEVLLGGRNRQGVNNPSRYLTLGVQRMSLGLGVEQGLAMELAVSVGVVLNNEALDELASIPRKESHAIIREVSLSEEARASPISYIKAQVAKVRAAAEARPFGFRG